MKKRALSTEKQIALEMDLLMERGRGRCQQFWPPYALFQKKVSAQCLQKSLEHRIGRKRELWPPPAAPVIPTLLAGTGQGEGHTSCGCHRDVRKCAEQVQSICVLTGQLQGGHPLAPAPGSQWSPPTHPALPNHCQFWQNGRSFLNSRCRLHGRPYGLTQGFTNSTVSMQSGKWWGSWLGLAGCSARTCVWPHVYV